MKINKIMMLVGLAIMASLTITSCKVDRLDTNPLNKKGVNLVAYGPNPVARGGYMRFMGSGMDQITSVTLAGQELTIEPVNKEEFKTLIPQDAKIGKVVLKANDGTEIVGAKEVTYTEPVGFDADKAFEPATIKAGQTLTINGEYLNLVTKVILPEGIEVTKFKEHDRKHIVIEKFPAEAQTGKVTLSFVATGDTMAQEIPSPVNLNVVLPSVAEIAEFTEVKAGDKKTIEGKNLDLVVDVLTSTGDTLDFIVSNEGAQIEITMPEVVTNCVINVFAASGIAVPVATIGVALPKVTSVEANTDVREGSEVVINGTDMAIVSAINFVDIKGNAITVDGDGISVTDTKVTVAVPAMAVTGAMVIKTTAGIDVEDEALTIKTLQPAITAFNPAEIAMGGTVAVNGTNLDLVAKVTLTGGAVLTPADASATTFNITIPYADAETGKVTLTMANGETKTPEVELTINAPECCYATAWPDPEVEIKAGTMMVITVANIDKLTTVKIDGQDCQIIKMGDQLYIAVPESAGKNSVITLVSENGSIDYPYAFVPNTEQKRTLWKGIQPLSWGTPPEGQVHIAYDEVFKSAPVGAELVICYTQPVADWPQMQFNNGSWQAQKDLVNPDGSVFTNSDGAVAPKALYGDVTEPTYRETSLILTQEVLSSLVGAVDEWGNILHLQGADFILNEVFLRWTISLEVDIKDFAQWMTGEAITYPFTPSWSDGPGKGYLFRSDLQALNLKAGKSKVIVYKTTESKGQLQWCNPSGWGTLTTFTDWNGTESALEWVLNEDAIKCVSGDFTDGSDHAFYFQGDGMEITKITILP